MGYVYQLIFPNQKSYIGITSRTIKQRIKEHQFESSRDKCKLVFKAIQKYKIDNIIIKVLDENDDWKYLCKSEQKYIKEKNSLHPNGYNLTLGGEGTLGKAPNPNQLAAASRTMKKLWKNKKFREQAIKRSKTIRIKDGLSKFERYRLKDLEGYRKRKREWAKTPSQKEKRKIYARQWRAKQKLKNKNVKEKQNKQYSR